MARRKKYGLTPEVANLLTGLIFLFLSVLVYFSTKGLVYDFFESILNPLFGPGYKVIFSLVIFCVGVGILLGRMGFDFRRFLGLLLFWLTIVSLIGFFQGQTIGYLDIHEPMIGWIDVAPFVIIFGACLLFSLYLLFHISYLRLAHKMRRGAKNAYAKQIKAINSLGPDKKKVAKLKETLKAEKAMDKEKDKQKALEEKIAKLEAKQAKSEKAKKEEKPKVTTEKTSSGLTKKKFEVEDLEEKGTPKTSTSEPETKPKAPTGSVPNFGKWDYPSIELLKKHPRKQTISKAEIELQSAIIEQTLLQFKIDVTMEGYKVGPTVIQHRLKPAEGIKLNKIENLKKDLSLALKAKSIRIQAPIPGQGLVGIEVPNEHREVVGLREIAEHRAFSAHRSNLAMCVGADISGDPIVADLVDMPHLLIAGQTGSGKSVGMNGFLISLLMKNSPSQLRMILIDPKRVELDIYNGIPHLLVPVINNADKALNALKWSVAEMVRRYDLLTEAKCRNIFEYNDKATKEEKLPNIAIVIDELADLMMSGNKKDVENAIARIAQMARAVGMHLIVATQRPSVDVITGLIKANIPSRIAFTVASQVDSRTILDRIGAEDLLGRGDMLYNPSGATAAERIQGVFVSTEEVEKVIRHIKLTIDPEMLEAIYNSEITEGESSAISGVPGSEYVDMGDDEEIIKEAVELVRATGKASTSLLQRRLKLGYARAARVIDILEEMGVVGPADGSKPRQVL